MRSVHTHTPAASNAHTQTPPPVDAFLEEQPAVNSLISVRSSQPSPCAWFWQQQQCGCFLEQDWWMPKLGRSLSPRLKGASVALLRSAFLSLPPLALEHSAVLTGGVGGRIACFGYCAVPESQLPRWSTATAGSVTACWEINYADTGAILADNNSGSVPQPIFLAEGW